MEEIKVNEYVRYKDGDIIQVFSKIDKTYVIKTDKEKMYTLPIKAIYKDAVKHSLNIIDILKIGDLIYTEYGWGWYHHKVDEETIVIDDGDEFIDVKKDEIHRILTQEMLWDNSYELKE